MGCAASKIENEDVVRRCKERRRLMKDAVYARHHLAGAHADYCRSLRLTGSALSSFASHEPLPISLSTPAAVLLRQPSSAATTTPIATTVGATPPPAPPPLSRSSSTVSAASSLPVPPRVPTSPSVNRLRNNPSSGHNGLNKPSKFKVKLPHILSESSPNSSPSRGLAGSAYPTAYIINNKGSAKQNRADDYDYGSTYASTPSQASSVWNWENLCPPSPPDSEYFDRRATEIKEEEEEEQRRRRQHLSGYELDEDGETTSVSEYDFFDNRKRQGSNISVGRVGSHKFGYDERSDIGFSDTNKGSKVDKRAEAEEVQCSEWGDHDYDSITSSSDENEGDEEDNAVRSEVGTIRSAVGESVKGRSEDKRSREEELEEKKSEIGMKSSTISYGRSNEGNVEEEMRMVVRHKDLQEIVDAIRENFDSAAAAGDQVSEMLEIGRAQMDKSFRQLKSE